MYINIVKCISIIFLSILLTGCGGGGGSSASTSTKSNSASKIISGYLIDSAISGVDYSCNSITGTTDSLGKFSCEENSTVSFSIGGIFLGNLVLRNDEEMITPAKLYNLNEDNTSDIRLINFIRLVQSLDNDQDASNGISISDDTKNLLPNVDLDISSTNLSEADLSLFFDNLNIDLISEVDALVHYKSVLENELHINLNNDKITDKTNTDLEFSLNFSSWVDPTNSSIITMPDIVKKSTASKTLRSTSSTSNNIRSSATSTQTFGMSASITNLVVGQKYLFSYSFLTGTSTNSYGRISEDIRGQSIKYTLFDNESTNQEDSYIFTATAETMYVVFLSTTDYAFIELEYANLSIFEVESTEEPGTFTGWDFTNSNDDAILSNDNNSIFYSGNNNYSIVRTTNVIDTDTWYEVTLSLDVVSGRASVWFGNTESDDFSTSGVHTFKIQSSVKDEISLVGKYLNGSINDISIVETTAPETPAPETPAPETPEEVDLNDYVNVKDYGATGNGTTDDTSAIESANVYAKNNGKNLYFPNGIYYVTSLKFYNNVSYLGESKENAIIKRSTSSTRDTSLVLRYGGRIENISVRGLTFDANHTESDVLIHIIGTINNFRFTGNKLINGTKALDEGLRVAFQGVSRNITIDDNIADQMHEGVFRILTDVKGNENISISNNSITRSGDTIIGIYTDTDHADGDWGAHYNVKVNNNRMTNLTDTGNHGAIPIEVWGVTNYEATYNYIDSGTRGMTATFGIVNGTITNNTILNQTEYAFESGHTINTEVAYNTVINCRTFMKYTSDSAEGKTPNKTIDNLHVHHNSITGGHSSYNPTSYAIYSKSNIGFRNVTFENNTFTNYTNGRGTIRIDGTYAEPKVTFSGNGSGAEGYALLKVVDVVVFNPGSGYSDINASINSSTGGSGANIRLNLTNGKISSTTINNSGGGYREEPQLTLSSSSGNGAYVRLIMGIEKIVITKGGSGYSSASISVSGSGGYSFRGTVNLSGGSVSSVTINNNGREYGRGSNITFRDNIITAEESSSPERVIEMSGQNVSIDDNTIDMERHFSASSNATAFSMVKTPTYGSNTNIIPISWNFTNNNINANNTYDSSRNRTYFAIGAYTRSGNYEGIRIEGNTIEGNFMNSIINPSTTSGDYVNSNNNTSNATLK